MKLPDFTAEIEPQRDKSGDVTAWKFTLFFEDYALAAGRGATVPLAAQWCARRLRENATRGLQALEAMGFDTTEPAVTNGKECP